MPDCDGHPTQDEMDLGAILVALADPHRRRVVRQLLQSDLAEQNCSSFDLPVTKATRTHHFRILREAGLIRQRNIGNGRMNQLRTADLDARFPGLLSLLAGEPPK